MCLAHQALILRSHSADLWIGNGLGILAPNPFFYYMEFGIEVSKTNKFFNNIFTFKSTIFSLLLLLDLRYFFIN
jgi:hypothetical protein